MNEVCAGDAAQRRKVEAPWARGPRAGLSLVMGGSRLAFFLDRRLPA
jgi:hypothetical protein